MAGEGGPGVVIHQGELDFVKPLFVAGAIAQGLFPHLIKAHLAQPQPGGGVAHAVGFQQFQGLKQLPAQICHGYGQVRRQHRGQHWPGLLTAERPVNASGEQGHIGHGQAQPRRQGMAAKLGEQMALALHQGIEVKALDRSCRPPRHGYLPWWGRHLRLQQNGGSAMALGQLTGHQPQHPRCPLGIREDDDLGSAQVQLRQLGFC